MKTALEKIEEEALQEIKDYSTGKKYFVSKFQDNVRKHNIKAKKKLIGTGNEGALSGTGPMEEQIEIDETIEKEGSEYCLKAKSGRNLGCSTSRAGAEQREREVNYFKHKKKKVKESISLEEGIMDWINSRLSRNQGTEKAKPPKQEEAQEYINVSKPDPSHELYIGAFPLPNDGQLDDAMNRWKFDFIVNMSIDIKKLFENNPIYKKYKDEQKIIDEFAFEDEDFNDFQYAEYDNPTEQSARIIQTMNQSIERDTKIISDAANKVKELIDSGKKVLVVCTEGVNRSVVTTIMALIALGKTNLDAYQLVKKARLETFAGPVRAREEEEAAKYGTRLRDMRKNVLQISSKPHRKFRTIAGLPQDLEESLKKLIAQALKEYYNR
jgi:hypothetical protein